MMPQGTNMSEVLGQLGVNVPAPLQGMMPGQMKDVLNLQRQLTQTERTSPTFQTLYNDPEKSANLVLSMWRNFNSYLQGQGGTPVGLMEFIQGGGFRPEIQMMFQSLFADPGMGAGM